jgi:hypothetical protein
MPRQHYKTKYGRSEFWSLHWYKELRTKQERRAIYGMARRAGMDRAAANVLRDVSNRKAAGAIKDFLRKDGRLDYKANAYIDKRLPVRIIKNAQGVLHHVEDWGG